MAQTPLVILSRWSLTKSGREIVVSLLDDRDRVLVVHGDARIGAILKLFMGPGWQWACWEPSRRGWRWCASAESLEKAAHAMLRAWNPFEPWPLHGSNGVLDRWRAMPEAARGR